MIELEKAVQGLNPPQREAVLHTQGPLIVLAGAGSGKTKMLTSRIAYLIESCGVAPYQILAVTFTNKAAQEMRERVASYLQSFTNQPEIGTFHSVCVRILRREAEKTPFTQPFVIYDDGDQLSLIKSVLRKLNLDEKTTNPKAIQGSINRFKCDATEPHEIKPASNRYDEEKLKLIYTHYQQELFANNAVDFGEILCMTYRLLRDHPEIRKRYQDRYRFIHVDEYQDTNRVQYLLLSLLARTDFGGHKNICVVGDEDQSIYKWRGADIRNILDFETDYPGAKLVKLEQNYRSTQTIISAASHVIKNNLKRKNKTLWTENPQGLPISRIQFPDERAEAETVVSEIKKLCENEGYAFEDFAVFYRTHAQSRQFEDVLRREKILYKIVGGLRFYDRKEIKDVLSYFKVIMNPQDSVSLKRIINVPGRGIGKVTLDKIEELASLGGGFWGALQQAAQDPSVTSGGTARKLAQFVALIERLIREQPRLKLSELYHLILDETGYIRDLKSENSIEASTRVENLQEFDTLLQEFEEDQLKNLGEEEAVLKKKELLPLFLEQSTLVTEVEGQKDFGRGVSLMTLHSSKGLEFPAVFLVGMEEGLFPSLRIWEEEDPEAIEEERRLCYVGMTRARERLYLFHVSVRRIWGNISYQEPARFFTEIPDEFMEFRDLTYGASEKSSASSWNHSGSYSGYSSGGQPHSVKKPASLGARTATPVLQEESFIGQKLDHPDYGMGSVVFLEGAGEDKKLTIEFRGRQKKKFLYKYLKAYLED